MLKVLSRESINDVEIYLAQKIYQGFSQSVFIESKADVHIIYQDGEKISARCSAWFIDAPKGKNNEKIGTIGHFEALEEETAKKVLEKACDILRDNGCKSAIGPMDGNTWRRYRFVTYSDGSNPFLLEPQNPLEYPKWFKNCGFTEDAYYFSKRSEIPKDFEQSCKKISELEDKNIKIREIDISQLDSELDVIYEISAVAFSNNLYYTELDRDSFKKQYYTYKEYLISDIILLAFHNDKPIGFVFLIPDYNEMKTKGRIETVIAKTIAVLPEYRQIGLSNAMLKKHIEIA